MPHKSKVFPDRETYAPNKWTPALAWGGNFTNSSRTRQEPGCCLNGCPFLILEERSTLHSREADFFFSFSKRDSRMIFFLWIKFFFFFFFLFFYLYSYIHIIPFFFMLLFPFLFFICKERKGGSTRKRIFPPLPKILLCAHPRKEWALPSRCKKCKSRQPSSRTACLITVTAQPGMLNDERGGLVLSAWLDEWWLWEQRVFGAFLSLLCKSWLLKNRFSWVKLKMNTRIKKQIRKPPCTISSISYCIL